MGKIILLLVLAVVVYAVVRAALRSRAEQPKPAAREPSGEDMVACARCGVNLPRSEARLDGSRFVCLANPNCR